jgi:hypothetical protein
MNIAKKSVAYLLILLPALTFFGLFFRYTLNVPVNDDYPAVLQFLNNYVSTHSYMEKLRLLFSQHNEHRIVFSRVWTVITFKLLKAVNFNVLSFIGDLSLVGIAIVFFRKFLSLKKSLFLFIPVTVFLFNITSWENMDFAMCALSNFVVHFFILLSLAFLASSTAYSKKNVVLALIFFFAAMMTQGAGLSLYPVSICLLIYKKEYKNLLIYLVVATLILLFYFHGYQRPPSGTSPLMVLRDMKVRSILFALAFLGNAFDYFLVFTNEVQESIGISTVIGFGFLLLFLYITKKKYYKRNLFNYSIMLLVVLTSLVTAISRSPMGLETAGASRYRINGIIFFISLYFWFIETYKVETKRALLAILTFTGWYYLMVNLNQYEYLSVREEQLNLEVLATNARDSSLVSPDRADTERQRAILDKSAALHVYYLPTDADIAAYLPVSVRQPDGGASANSSLEMTGSIHQVRKCGQDWIIDGFAFLQWRSAKHQQVFVGLKNQADSGVVFFTAKQIPRFDLNPFFHRFDLRDGGFRARINTGDVKPGENSVWLKIEVGDQVKIIQTENKLIK